MNIKSFLNNNWIHFVILFLFLVITVAYFSPEFNGYGLKQHDIEQHKGMSNEIQHFRETTGEEPFWTNSMFGGMPAVQISILYNGNLFQKFSIWFLGAIGVTSGIFLLHLIGFYILGLCLRIKPIISFLGSLAFSLSTYEIIILQAGHNSKAIAVAFMAPVLGAFIMSYRNNWKWGVILSALFMSFELSANHLQVTYYLAFLFFAIGFYELFMAIKIKQTKQFFTTTFGLICAYTLALMINYGNITSTYDYSKHTIRGANDLTITEGGKSVQNEDGLDIDYITNWSYGIGESFTFISPYVKGSHSTSLRNMPLAFRDQLKNSDRTSSEIKNLYDSSPFGLYWGEQPITSGPFYLGISVIFLAILSLVFLKDKIKWVFFFITILALMLSWGKNFIGLTDFFVEYIPGYNKFRTVTIINVLIELCIPLMGVLFLQKIYINREEFKLENKKFLITSASFLLFMLVIYGIGLGDNFTNPSEINQINEIESSIKEQIYSTPPQQLSEYGIDINNKEQIQNVIQTQVQQYDDSYNNLKKFRSEIFNSSILRSIGFLVLSILIISLFFFTNISSTLIIGSFSLLILIDLVPVNRLYLGTEKDASDNYIHWVPKEEILYPISSQESDIKILESEIDLNPKLSTLVEDGKLLGERKAKELEYTGKDKRRIIDSYKFSALNMNTNYRVFDLNGGWGSSRASYFHKSLGGYHGAKLRNIQNLFEFQISKSNSSVFDMLNVKYFIQGNTFNINPKALGNVWLINEIKTYKSPDDEIRALGGTYKLKNMSSGKLYVNSQIEDSIVLYGSEDIIYIKESGDSINIPISNGLKIGLKAILVSDIYGQTNVIPESTLLLDTLNSFISMVSIEKIDEFIPSREALMLNSEFKKISTNKFSGDGFIKMKSYAPNKIIYDADIKGKQFAVFSEIYYPDGWTAKVDGKKVDIVKVNYLLRGLELNNGSYKIEFSYDIPKIKRSNIYSIIGTIFLISFIAYGFWKIPTKTSEL